MVTLRALVCLAVLVSQGALASVKTTVGQDKVAPGQSIEVTFDADQNVGQPDFSPLEKDFDIVDQNQSQSISIINGKSSYDFKWTLVLMPKRTGTLELPRIHFGSELSQARTITVLGGSARTARRGDVFIDYKVDDPTPDVNDQVLLTTKVYTAVHVDNLHVSVPRIVKGQGRIDKLGGGHVYRTTRSGRRYTVHEQRYNLMPESTGDLELSPIEVRGSIAGAPLRKRTKPLELNVLPMAGLAASQGGGPGPRDLFVDVAVDNKSPYVQEQVLYTVRVFRAVNIDNASLNPPKVSGGDAVVERVGKDHRYPVTRGGRQYSVTERRFAVFPQSSGTLTIEPVVLQASVPARYSGGAGNFFGIPLTPLTRPVQVRSAAIELNVKPPPAGAPNPWLPARHVTLEEDWPKQDSVKVGTPITRRIVVKANALVASELPDLKIRLPAGIKSYPERPQRKDDSGPNGITGRLEQTIAIIPAKPGTFTVPGIKLDWWNTATDRKQTLSLPSHTLHVAASPAASPPVSSPPAGTHAKMASTSPTSAPEPSGAPAWSWWIAGALGGIWVLTLALWWWERRYRGARPAKKDASDIDLSLRQARKRLREACRKGDPAAARDALLDWARVCWPERPPRSLGAVGERMGDPIATEVAALQQVLYRPGGASWRGSRLYRGIASWKPRRLRPVNDDAALKALYEN